MIDWKEIYGQAKPLFDTYYQWQVIFVVGEGLFLFFLNHLIYRYLKKREYAFLVFSFLMVGNVFYAYQSYYRLSTEIQVFQYKTELIDCDFNNESEEVIKTSTVCYAYNPIAHICEQIFKKAFNIHASFITTVKIIDVFAHEKQPEKLEQIELVNYWHLNSLFDSTYQEKFKIFEKTMIFSDSINLVYSKKDKEKQYELYDQFECRQIREQAMYLNNQTYMIGIRKNNIYYPFLFMTKQGEIIYKISKQQLKEYIF